MMKKLLLIMLMLSGFGVFGQLTENFEGAIFPPAGWTNFETGTGTTKSWAETNLTQLTYLSTGKSAYMDRENVASGLAIDWLVTSQITVPANGQLRFYTKTVQPAFQNTQYEIKVSSVSQTTPTDFTTIQTWTDATITSVVNVYEEKVLDLTAYAGTQIYIAFVMSGDNGDRWLLDNINVVQKCDSPIAPLATLNETPTSAQLSWGSVPGITQWQVEVVLNSASFTGVPNYPTTTNNPFTITGLVPNTLYKYKVRSICANGFESDWFGTKSFRTTAYGQVCSGPIVIPPTLPFQTTDNTANYGDSNDLQPPTPCTGSSTNYMAGNDVFYSYTPNFTGNVSINLAPTTASSSLHVYNACPGTVGATCISGVGSTNTNPRNINPFPVVAGTTYYIIVSSSAAQQTVGYTLTIQQVFCNAPTGLTATNITTNSADLNWAASAGTVNWQYSYAPAPYGLPTGAGTATTSNTSNVINGLVAGTVYQYYVRADCNDTNFSTWAGPFTLTIPQVATALNFVDGFENLNGWTLNNGSQSSKWAKGTAVNNGGTQALYITDTNGATNTYNNASSATVHAFKDFIIPAGATQVDLLFDWRSIGEAADHIKVWTVPTTFSPTAGTAITATANRVLIGNILHSNTNFITQNSTLNVVPYAGGNMRLIFEWINNNTAGNQPPAAIDNVRLNLVTCPKPTTLLASNITSSSAQINWTNGGAEAQWQYVIVPAASAAPNAATVGTTITTKPYTITGLNSVTCYDVYVRAICSASETSGWSALANFCTTPNFCAGDHFTDAGGLNGDYPFNQNNVVTTICATNPGDVVTVVFNSFATEDGWDKLSIFDGNSVGAPLLGVFDGNALPPTFTSTAVNGCLTFSFFSDGITNEAGWDATINCTPPITCFKPVALAVNNVTATSASLSWTETNNATQWEIFIVPLGSNGPSFGQVGIPVNSNPYLLNGLAPSTTYTYYVRSICTATDASFWSVGSTFSTTPLNDNCLNAKVATVNDDLICTQTNSGTISGATPSVSVPGSCSVGANDVWYKFVATRGTHTMSLNDILPVNSDIKFALYEGADCNALTQIKCFTNVENVVSSLVIGQTYYVRVFTTDVNALSFKLCIGGIPCPESVALCNAPITYPNTTNVIDLGKFGCLSTSPNASFFFLEAAQTGTLGYSISQTSGDVDYALWGPFPNRNFGCGLVPMQESTPATTPLSAYPNNPLSCSYTNAATESFNINVLQGEVYILMVTNFVNQTGTITITPNAANTAQTFCYPYNTFNYSASTYCASSVSQAPVLVAGAVAGTYSAVRDADGSTSALSIHSTTGVINFAASLPGVYTVTSTLIPTLPLPASNAPIVCTRTVIVTPIPNATISYSNASYCKSNTELQSVSITGTGGTGGYFSATPAGLENALNAASGTIIPVLGNVGVYTIKYTVPEQGGCAEYFTTTQIEILASPVIPSRVDVSGCNSYVLPALSIGNYFTGSGGTGTALPAGSIISSNQTIYVYATNGQCASEDAFNVVVVNMPTPTFDFLTQPTCAVQTGSINITAPVGLGSALPSGLFISEVTDASSGSLTYVELFNGTGATVNLSGYRLKVYNNGNTSASCNNLLSGTIANNATFVVKLSSDPSIPGVAADLAFASCAGINNNDNIRLTTAADVVIDMWGPTDGSTFTPAGQAGYTYRRLASATPLPNPVWNAAHWTALDPENYSNLGLFSPNISGYAYSVDGGTYVTTTTFTGLTPGSHTLIVHDLVSNCYSAPISFTINAVPYTNPNTSFSYTTPVCNTSVSTIPSVVAGFTSGGVFSYTIPVGSTGTALNLNVNTGEITLAGSASGTYDITYTYALDLANCINLGSTTTSVTILPYVTATFLPVSNICQNTTPPVLPTTSTNNITGSWNALINTSTPGLTTYVFTPTIGQCGSGTTLNVTIDPIVAPVFNPIGNLCLNENPPLLSNMSNNGIEGVWNPLVINTSNAGTFTYTFTPVNGECSSVLPVQVVVNPKQTPLFAQIQPLCVGDTAVTLPTTSTNGIVGTWSPSIVSTINENLTVYTFTPSNVLDCANIVTMKVQVSQCEIQKGISPNNDGNNDFLQLVAKKVEIFNRYGKEVYSKVDYNNDWHGQFMGGGEMPDGTYYYVIELISGEKKSGWIYINREQ